jgi:hypothetical protein
MSLSFGAERGTVSAVTDVRAATAAIAGLRLVDRAAVEHRCDRLFSAAAGPQSGSALKSRRRVNE